MPEQTRWKVMVSAPYLQPELEHFRPLFDRHQIELFVPPVKERLSEAELLTYIGDIDGVICGNDRFTQTVLEAAPHLKVISKWGTGIDAIDQDACARLGITVCNTPNAFTDPVADSALAYVLCFARKLPWLDRQMHQGGWHKRRGMALRECILGVIGVGNVGKAVVARTIGFGMRVLGHDPAEMPAEFLEKTGIEMVSLDGLLQAADFVSLHCDLNPTSRHLISKVELASMKDSAVLINTARGSVVDERALVEALQAGKIAGAALDVFEDEPLPSDSPLLQMDNVMLSPHSANSSPEAWEHVHQNTVNNLIQGLLR